MDREPKPDQVQCLRCVGGGTCTACGGTGWITPSPYVQEVLRRAVDAFGSVYDDDEQEEARDAE